MKKHILSNYLKQVKKLVIPSKDDTIVTESMETNLDMIEESMFMILMGL